MRNYISIIILILLVISQSINLTACSPSSRNTDSMVGKWEANIVRPTGYGTEDRQIVLEVNSDDQCFETTTDPNTGVIYGERNCALEVRSDGNTWNIYDDGTVLRADFQNEQLIIYGMFPSFGTEPDVKFFHIQ